MHFGVAVGAQQDATCRPGGLHLGWRNQIPIPPVPGQPDPGFDLPTAAGQLAGKVDGRT
jgi:hypothetical protein